MRDKKVNAEEELTLFCGKKVAHIGWDWEKK